MKHKIIDYLPVRRDFLKLGGYGLLGAFAGQALWPLKVRAAGKAKPRGTAACCVLIELAGAISHCDTFDFKESAGTPKDLDVRPIGADLHLSHKLFPELSSEMHRIAIVRSLKSHEVVHQRGQYYTQAGRPLIPAQAAEIPSIGSVVSYELEATRRESDTFPTYVAFNLGSSECGALSTGFLHPRHSVLDINLKSSVDAVAIDGDAMKLLEERYRLLEELDTVAGSARMERDRLFGGFRNFQDGAFGILRDRRWAKAFQVSIEERKRYGDNEIGQACLFTRNMIQADGGTRYFHLLHPDWDHHKQIYDHTARSNHYVRCNEIDRALANLLRDLAAAPSAKERGKTLLDETLVVVVSEFGRVPGPLNAIQGRHHHNLAYHALFAGAGVKGGRIIGKTDPIGQKVVESGWRYKAMQTKTENIYATIYSSLGIDWTKEILNTPSKRAYRYVDVLGATEFVMDDEITELFI